MPAGRPAPPRRPLGHANPGPRAWLWAAVLGWLGWAATTAAAPDLKATRNHFLAGRYEACIQTAQEAIIDGEYEEEWRTLLIQGYLTTGRYSNAMEVVSSAVDRYPNSLRLRLLGRTAALYNGEGRRARLFLHQINSLATGRMWAYRDAANLVAMGEGALLLGADARRVLEQFFDVARNRDPKLRDAYLASGELALTKGDFQVAAKLFQDGLKALPDDPDLHCGLARAFAPSNRRQMLTSLEKAMTLNTNHVPSRLLLADHLVDAEDYTEAVETLDEVFAVNPWQPEAWAYRAVIAHLNSKPDEEADCRGKALAYWTNNPAVDHIIGRKLSQKYRFAEGAAAQRQALAFDASFQPVKIQLAQDLLRLGQEAEGWALAKSVHDEDGYDTTAFNLVTLKEQMDKFATLTNEHFILRMNHREASIYGQRALALLERARTKLCARYGLTLQTPTIVEIFPEQRDFGVRTFGMPDNPGFLGVCFGSVITANSPASHAGANNNWEAVLWHEFCHVVTLQLTRNKMPRWLSEGISVHEELQANPAWGQVMNPRYREMVLDDTLTPVSQLSAAFLAPKSDFHLQFAYYQSALVVEFLVQRFGQQKLAAVLRDLGDGVEINDALTRHTAPMDEIETEFAAFARRRAEELGPGLDWSKPDEDELAAPKPEWLAQHSKNYYVLWDRARKAVQAKKWDQARPPLETLVELYPDQRGSDSAHLLLAAALRETQEPDRERTVLRRLAVQDGEATEAYLRLMEIDRSRKDWGGVRLNAERYLAVNPLSPHPHRFLADAAEAQGDAPQAIAAYRTLLHLDVPDPAQVHFRLARQLHATGDPAARRQVLQALEEAPRFRDAHRLLLDLGPTPTPPASDAAPQPAPPTPPKAP